MDFKIKKIVLVLVLVLEKIKLTTLQNALGSEQRNGRQIFRPF